MRRLFSKARNTGRKTRQGESLSPQKYPPEILQEIFVHCCWDEYIDFFSHSPIEHEIIQTCQTVVSSDTGEARQCEWDYNRRNTVYVLKAVCKEWRTIAEGTPELWQRLYLEFQPTPTITDPLPSFYLSETHLTNFSRRYGNMLKHVFISRSGGMALHLRIGATGPSSHNAGNLRGAFMKLLFGVLAEESQRWATLELTGMSLTVAINEFFRPPNSRHDPMSFPNLRQLSADVSPEYKDTVISASRLSKLTLYGVKLPPEFTVKTTLAQSQNLTTLVMSDCYSYHLDREWSTSQFIGVLKAVPNLMHLHWQGRFGAWRFVYPRIPTPVALEKLLSITMEDSDMEFCGILPRLISCPKLQALRLLVGAPMDGAGPPTPREAISSIASVLQAAPLLRNVTVVQCKSLLWSSGAMENVKTSYELEYIFYSGTRAQFVGALQRDKRWSKLSPDSPLGTLPAEIMTVESATKLRKHISPDRIPSLTVPTHPLTGWAGRRLHICSEERLENIFDFVDFIANDWPRGKTSSSIKNAQLPETWHGRGCLPTEFEFLIQFMEMVRSKQFPSDSCSFTFSVILSAVVDARRLIVMNDPGFM